MKEKQKQKKKKKSHIPVRMNILFFSVFLLFSVLILRLGIIQIVQGEEYRNQVEKKVENAVDFSVPRGEIYDRNHNKVVINIPQKAITYTPATNPKRSELLEISQQLGQLIQMSESDLKAVTERDKKDFWLLTNNNGDSKITEEEFAQLKAGNLNDDEIYRMKLERITEDDLSTIDINIASIYRKVSTAMSLTPMIVKNEEVTDIEFALVSENLADLPGVDVTTDWKREKVYGNVLNSVIGRMEEGLRSEDKDYYLSKGYSLNDRVGTSYIEKEYEEVLQGTKSVVKTVTDKNGGVIESEVIAEGESGKDLILTVDMGLQEEIEKIVIEEIITMKEKERTEKLDRAFVVAMNPQTGEILSLVGKQLLPNDDNEINEDDFIEFSHGTFNQAFEMGSTVKGATVLAGYQTGVISPGDYKYDTVMHLAGNVRKSSWKPSLGNLNDLGALEQSSNVYMWNIAIEIMDGKYVPYGSLPLNYDKINDIRYYFSQFGLGNETGFGFEAESFGVKGKDPYAYMNIAIGQLDTYTPLQLAQYVSTIANDGYRMRPYIVKEIRNASPDGNELGVIVQTTEPEVLNRVDMKDEWVKRVQEGFWLVTHGSKGTARSYFANEPYNAAGKTGTAQSPEYYNGRETYNSTFVGYAPYENPEIAIAVVVPSAYYGNKPYDITNIISRRVFRAYFDLKEERMKTEDEIENNEETDNSEQGIEENTEEVIEE